MTRKLLIAILAIGVLTIMGIVLFMWWTTTQSSSALPSALPAATSSPSLFPSGNTRTPITPVSSNNQTPTLNTSPAAGTSVGSEGSSNLNSPLYQISTKPVSGLFVAGTGATSSLVYVEKATGHLYQVAPASRLPSRISNTTLPKIYQVWGGATKSEVRILAQYLKDGRVQNYNAGLALPTVTNEDSFIDEEQLPSLRGRVWDNGVFNAAVSPKQDQLFYLTNTLTNGAVGYISDWTGSAPNNVFNSPLTEWTSQWATTTTIALYTKPGQDVPGYLYWLSIKNKELTPIISEVPGLSALANPNLKTVLYSALNKNQLTFGLYDIATKIFNRLSITTLAEKCVWSKTGQTAYCGVPRQLPAGEYPDAWYRGEISLADNIWQITNNTKQPQLLFNPKLSGVAQDIDAINLTLSSDEKTLYFINKNDNTLWGLNLVAGF